MNKWKNALKELNKVDIFEIFDKYEFCLRVIEQGVGQNLAASYRHAGGRSRNFDVLQQQIESKVDAEQFVKDIDDCLRELASIHRYILTEYYQRGRKHWQIQMSTGYPNGSYYRALNEAINTFMRAYTLKKVVL